MSADSPGFIYVVQMAGHDYFKVGRSTNVRRRISELQLPAACQLIFAHRVANASRVERRIHRQFNESRLNGEWFSLTPYELREIQAYLLFVQADNLINRVLRALAADDDLFPQKIIQYGKVIFRAGDRLERRLKVITQIEIERFSAKPDPVLEAEFLG